MDNNSLNISNILDYIIGYSIRLKLSTLIYGNNFSQWFIKLLIFNIKDNSINKESYYILKNLFILPLFTVSGFHINLLVLLMEKILKKINIKVQKFIILTFLIFYVYLLNFSLPVTRALLSYLFYNFVFVKFKISSIANLIIVFLIMLTFNPYFLFSIGFQLTFIITFFIKYFQNWFIYKNFLISSALMSLFASCISLPIISHINDRISIFLIIYNIIFSILIPYIFIYLLFFSWWFWMYSITNFIITNFFNLAFYLNQFNLFLYLSKYSAYYAPSFYTITLLNKDKNIYIRRINLSLWLINILLFFLI